MTTIAVPAFPPLWVPKRRHITDPLGRLVRHVGGWVGGASQVTAAAVGPTVFVDPSSLANLVLWLRPTTGLVKRGGGAPADTDPIEAWSDQSGQGNDVTQDTEAAQPLYVASGQNSKPMVDFDASDDILSSGSFEISNTFTLAIVYDNCSASDMLYEQRGGVDGAIHAYDGTNITFAVNKTGRSGLDGPAGFIPTSGIMVHRCNGSHATHTVRHNGGVLSTTTKTYSDDPTAASSGIFDLGARATALFQDARIGEVAIWNSHYAGDDLANIETFFNDYWGFY